MLKSLVLRSFLAAALLIVAPAAQSSAQVPAGYEPSYAEIVSDGVHEGAVRIDSTTEPDQAADMLKGFQALYPGIKVIYRKWKSDELYQSIATDADAPAGGRSSTADIVWSSAMDLQIKLVNDGYAQPYVSPEARYLPHWALWRYEAYGTTAEPVAIVYNKLRVSEAEVPRSHADLTRLLTTQPDAFQGRIASYNPADSGAGFLFLTQDVEVTPHTWDLVQAMGQAGVQLYTSSSAMLDAVSLGEQDIAYNVLGSYALERARQNQAIGVVLPSDYTIVLSRIAFIPNTAPHPNAARLFLDYLLSRQGQSELAGRCLTPVREDAASEEGMALPADVKAGLHPINIGPELLTYLDQAKRAHFLKRWQAALQDR